MTSQTPKETQDTDVEEVVEEVAGHLQHLLTIAEGKEEIEQWNTHAANLINAVTKVLHHQLQKARHDWLREEIVKLEGMKMANEHNSECLHNEAPEYCDCDNYIKWNKSLQTIIDRYQAELDQDTDNDCPKHGNSEVAKQLFWEKPLTSHWGCRCKSELDQEVGITSEDKTNGF